MPITTKVAGLLPAQAKQAALERPLLGALGTTMRPPLAPASSGSNLKHPRLVLTLRQHQILLVADRIIQGLGLASLATQTISKAAVLSALRTIRQDLGTSNKAMLSVVLQAAVCLEMPRHQNPQA